MKLKRASATTLLCLLLLPAGAAGQSRGPAPGRPPGGAGAARTFFDDFTYTGRAAMERRGWIIRAVPGWPGVPGATWRKENVTFHRDEERRGNRYLRMTSSTDGTAANTTQTQICHQRKYLEGTYAARVRFYDGPIDGPDGDQVVQSFYTISPLKAPMDLDYSELDFEYLPNGGWGIEGPTLYGTTWETFSPEPNWKKDNVFDTIRTPQGGWHTLVMQVADGKVRYFIDGKPLAEHGGAYYPESPMSINFNLWFIRDGLVKSSEARTYREDIDWVFHEAGRVMSPAEVEAWVADMRRRSGAFRDTVDASKLNSPCDF